MMEPAKQGMEHMMERGKDMLGMGHQTTGQVFLQFVRHICISLVSFWLFACTAVVVSARQCRRGGGDID
jgi:hypothetical protein